MSDNGLLGFTTYPISAAFRKQIEEIYGGPLELRLLSELRQNNPLKLLQLLRSFSQDRVVFPLEDSESEALLPLLLVLGAMTKARNIEALRRDLSRRAMRRVDAWMAAAGLFAGSVHGGVSVARTWQMARRMLRAPRPEHGPVLKGPVLYLNTNFWFGVKAGGSVGHVAGIVNGFQRLGWPVTYASIVGGGGIDADVVVRRIQPLRVYGFPAEANHYRFGALGVEALLPVARALRPSILYQRLSLGNLTGVELSRRMGIPLVIEYNGSNVWVSKNWGRPLRFTRTGITAEEACLRHAHRVLTVSQVSADELVERGVPPERVIWYPNCVDERVFDPARFNAENTAELRSNIGLHSTDLVVTFVGTFGPWHGAEVLAKAVAELAATIPQWLESRRVRFLFVGDGVRLPVVRDILERAGAARFAILRGLVPQHEAPRYLAASDILVSPHVPNADGSRFFGSPTKLFEYMAMSKAIVASDLDQVGEVLSPALQATALPAGEPGDTTARAVLGRPGHVADLVSSLRFLVENPAWREALGANARLVVSERYLWRHHVEHLVASL